MTYSILVNMENKIETFIEKYPDWYQEDNALVAGFEFASFTGLKNLIPKLLDLIEKENHHPTVNFDYNTIEIKTTTHDAGDKVTEKDLALAEKISELITPA